MGSIPTGRVWKGNLRTGHGAELVPNRYVYHARTGADIAQFNFTDESSFINDVAAARGSSRSSAVR